MKINPMETAPFEHEDFDEAPSNIFVHKGAWATITGTNDKLAGWVDTHELFADHLYRDQILTKQYTNTREPGEFGDGVTVEKMTDEGLVEKLRTVNIATAPYACPEAVDWCHEAADRISALSPRVVTDEMVEAGKRLKSIVEEVEGAFKHGGWWDENGVRLKDTPEWVAFYNALTAALSSPGGKEDDTGAMTPEEIRLEDLQQMAKYDGLIVSFDFKAPFYLASCDKCGWVGSSELCGTDSFGDDSDVYCPRCFASGADCGKVAEALASPHPTSADKVEVVGYVKEGDYRASGFEYISERSIDVLCVPLVRHSDATRIITACQQEIDRLRREIDHKQKAMSSQAEQWTRSMAEAKREGMEEAATFLRDHVTISSGETLDPAIPEILKALYQNAGDHRSGDDELTGAARQ